MKRQYVVMGGPKNAPARVLGIFPTWIQAWEAVIRVAVQESNSMKRWRRFSIQPRIPQ